MPITAEKIGFDYSNLTNVCEMSVSLIPSVSMIFNSFTDDKANIFLTQLSSIITSNGKNIENFLRSQ